jgi:hypothetical protein
MVVLEPDEPDWGGNDDEDIIPAIIIPVPKTVPRPLARPSGPQVRVGVDLGGVLTAKLPSAQLRTVRTTNDIDIKMGYVPGAVEWFADCVANYGAENVFVVNYVLSRRLRELFVGFSLRKMGCCTPSAFQGPTWFGQIPGQTNGGPLSRKPHPLH